MPSDLIPGFYKEYTTHAEAGADKYGVFWKVMSFIAPTPAPARGFRSGLRIPRNAAVLDFGCGAGTFLRDLKALGYDNLVGYDFDPQAAAASLEGIRFIGNQGQLSTLTFDVITLNHVIEHVEDPVSTLRFLRGLLKPGGIVYVRTPNSRSLMARLFGSRWRGWETPRHLNIFNIDSLTHVIAQAGARVNFMETSNDMLAGMFIGSMNNVLSGPAKKIAIALAYAPLVWATWIASRFNSGMGEELVASIRA